MPQHMVWCETRRSIPPFPSVPYFFVCVSLCLPGFINFICFSSVCVHVFSESGQSLLSAEDPTPPRASPNPVITKIGPHPSKLVDLGAAASYSSQQQRQPSAGEGTGMLGVFGDDPPPQPISTQFTGSLYICFLNVNRAR